jgi:hypothetical protein
MKSHKGIGFRTFASMGIIIVILYIALRIVIPFLLGKEVDIFTVLLQSSPLGFLIIVAAGVCAILSYATYKIYEGTGHQVALTLCKDLLNATPVMVFLGFIAIEIAIFTGLWEKQTTVFFEKCEAGWELKEASDIPKFLVCVLTGVYPSEGSITSVSFVTFILFFWLFPFFFLLYFFIGLFEGMFSGLFAHSTQVTYVMAFIVAMYGARQLIGGFLLDLYAYGVWGLVGIFIPLSLALGIKKLLDWAIPIRQEEAKFWSEFGSGVIIEAKQLKDEINRVQQLLMEAIAKEDQALANQIGEKINELDRRLSALDEAVKKLPGKLGRQWKAELNNLRKQLGIMEEQRKKGKK